MIFLDMQALIGTYANTWKFIHSFIQTPNLLIQQVLVIQKGKNTDMIKVKNTFKV